MTRLTGPDASVRDSLLSTVVAREGRGPGTPLTGPVSQNDVYGSDTGNARLASHTSTLNHKSAPRRESA
eukprot:6345397-Prymnesium_polylepis.1